MAADYEMMWRGALQDIFLTEQRVIMFLATTFVSDILKN